MLYAWKVGWMCMLVGELTTYCGFSTCKDPASQLLSFFRIAICTSSQIRQIRAKSARCWCVKLNTATKRDAWTTLTMWTSFPLKWSFWSSGLFQRQNLYHIIVTHSQQEFYKKSLQKTFFYFKFNGLHIFWLTLTRKFGLSRQKNLPSLFLCLRHPTLQNALPARSDEIINSRSNLTFTI